MLKEDKGSFVMRAGLQKRLLGNVKQVLNTWSFENKAYDRGVQQVRAMRKFQHDVVEIFGGFANITAEALEQGLRALQPVDSIYGVSLVKASDYKKLCDLLRDRRPFLVVWEIRCDPWSNINHLNFSAEELEALRAEHYESLKGMCDTIIKLHEELGMHFLLENPWGTPFWNHPQIERLMNLPHVTLRKGSMCRFGLRGKEGHLIRKHTGWLSDLSELLDELALECPGHGHQHEQCLGGNSKRAQVYTRQLARAVVKGLKRALARSGDERFIFPDAVRFSWTCGLSCTSPHHLADEAWTSHWIPAFYQAFYLDVDRTEESWRPILQEVENRLEGKVANSAIVKPGTAFYAQIQDLVPWSIHQVQICRTPKVRRTPHQLMLQKPVTHRAAVLRFDNGRLQVETEEAQHFSTTRFEAPVRFAVFIYGEAPQTSLNPEENAQNEGPEAARSSDSAAPKTLEPEEVLQRWQPGHRDITFEVQEGAVPRWVQNALRRLHVNLGHPSNESLTRHLAQAGASGQALLGAKHLQCKVCLRTRPPRQPRPAKAFQARRFNDRVFLDIIFVKNIEDTTFSYLNILDDASTYQSLATLPDRSEPTVVKVLVDGWLRYFGAPDHLVVDAEGALRGCQFEQLVAQGGVQLRFVPPDAHYQLGKCERHDQTVKWMMQRLVNQFAALSQEEMDLIAVMSTQAKNALVRRCGASPNQWVFGRQPKIPAALLSEPEAVEPKQLLDNSGALQQIEAVRHEAIKCFSDYEFDQSLRKAMLRKGRPFRGPLEIGQKIAYYRHRTQMDGEGSVEGYRQGMIIGLDPGPTGSVWIRDSRGRIVQASREQVRSVEGEELWTPSMDDISALKDAELDLQQKHLLAFDHRGPAPRALEDREVSRILDEHGQPVHDEASEAVVLPVPVPVQELEPSGAAEDEVKEKSSEQPGEVRNPATPGLVFLPPTPVPPPLSGSPALPAIPEESISDEPNAPTGSETTTSQLKLEDQPPAIEDKPASAASSATSRKREAAKPPSAVLSRASSRRLSFEEKGTKREAEQTTEQLRDTQGTEAVEPTPGASEGVSLFLVYCKQCGTRGEFTTKQCPRCDACDFVQDPLLVENWFDEVEEHEAMNHLQAHVYDPFYKRWTDAAGHFELPESDKLEDGHFAYLLNARDDHADRHALWSAAFKHDGEEDWTWSHLFETLDIDPETLSADMQDDPACKKIFFKHQGRGPRKIRALRSQPEARFLRRHGRHCSSIVGWDGTPPELQPAFENNSFLTAYNVLCNDIASENYAVFGPDAEILQKDAEYMSCHGWEKVQRDQDPTGPSVFNTHTDQIVGPDDSSDEEVAEQETSGRATRQALKREVPWQSISETDWPKFVSALRDEWQEWETWSSCQPVELREGEVDPKLILKSRVCYRWKPKDGGK